MGHARFVEQTAGLPKGMSGFLFTGALGDDDQKGRAGMRSAQGAVEYIIVLATLSLLVAFSGGFVQRILQTLDTTFIAATGKMVPP